MFPSPDFKGLGIYMSMDVLKQTRPLKTGLSRAVMSSALLIQHYWAGYSVREFLLRAIAVFLVVGA